MVFFIGSLPKHLCRKRWRSGQDIRLNVDLALAHDGSGPEILELFKKNRCDINSRCRILVTLDHCFPAPTIKDREFQREISDFAQRHNIHLYKNGEGVLHQVVVEEESLWPGMIVVGADGHVATAGAFSGIAFSVSPAEFVSTVCSGFYSVVVPEQVLIALAGEPAQTVLARDIGMHLMSRYGDEIRNKAVLLTGSLIEKLTISEKMSICNFLPEAGVATALVLPQGEEYRPDIRHRFSNNRSDGGRSRRPSRLQQGGSVAGGKNNRGNCRRVFFRQAGRHAGHC